MNNPNNIEGHGPSTLMTLRSLVPARPMCFAEALQLAELQASRLLELSGVCSPAVPEDIVTGLPHIEVLYRRLPTSGLTYWDRVQRTWVIAINGSEPLARQRFTLVHEYKHVVDHFSRGHLYRTTAKKSADQQAEHAADYFAGCVLMPKRLLKAAWGTGIQSPAALAELFEVSERAIEVRLSQIGLNEPRARCMPSHDRQRSSDRGLSMTSSIRRNQREVAR
jgi:Zn-dependent peptidase ImmA (M78 family)